MRCRRDPNVRCGVGDWVRGCAEPIYVGSRSCAFVRIRSSAGSCSFISDVHEYRFVIGYMTNFTITSMTIMDTTLTDVPINAWSVTVKPSDLLSYCKMGAEPDDNEYGEYVVLLPLNIYVVLLVMLVMLVMLVILLVFRWNGLFRDLVGVVVSDVLGGSV